MVVRLKTRPLIRARGSGIGVETDLNPHFITKQPKYLVALIQFGLGIIGSLHRVIQATFPKIARATSFIGRIFARAFLLPFYKAFTIIRLKYARVSYPARSLVLHLMTNRYLLHGGIVVIVTITVGTNFLNSQANAQDVGQGSLLYAMVAGDDARSSEQNAQVDILVQDSHYASPSSLIAMPDIDFDYESITEAEIPMTTPSVPGALIANLVPSTSDETTPVQRDRNETETYTVQTGDTLGGIAQKFSVTIGTILWSNGRTATQYIRPGDSLRIPPVSGVLAVVKKGDTLSKLAKTYSSDVEKIVEANKLDPEQALAVGTEIILPDGQPPAAAPVKTIAQNIPIKGIGPNTFATKPADADASATPSTKLLWPTSWHVITQYYGWNHTGIDLDGDYNSPLYASHDGVVTTAGWNNGGYGFQIVVEGAGVKTRYAHASKLFVKAGDTVKRGETIAMMGSTGRSTGTHLHYEVYINGVRTNPLPYIK